MVLKDIAKKVIDNIRIEDVVVNLSGTMWIF